MVTSLGRQLRGETELLKRFMETWESTYPFDRHRWEEVDGRACAEKELLVDFEMCPDWTYVSTKPFDRKKKQMPTARLDSACEIEKEQDPRAHAEG